MKMNAIHVNSTLPFLAKRGGGSYTIEPFSLYTTVISALEWRKNNGEIRMCTDKIGAEFYRKIGIDGVWNEICEVIPTDMENIDPTMFWAAGKLLALREMRGDYALVDEDFVVWKELNLSKTSVTVAHREDISSDIYPEPDVFGVDYPLLGKLDRVILPCNTAFIYIPDETFRVFYAAQSIAFMKSAEKCDDYLCRMVFAEQRLLAMLCGYCGIKIETLLDKEKLFVAQNDFTHLWGAKQAMRDNEKERERFMENCRRRICDDFPEYKYIIKRIDFTPFSA